MNANEVLANIALELSGHKKGEYHTIEPHDDLNMGQSTNDVYPTTIKVALLLHNDKLVKELEDLSRSFHKKGDEFKDILKMVLAHDKWLAGNLCQMYGDFFSVARCCCNSGANGRSAHVLLYQK